MSRRRKDSGETIGCFVVLLLIAIVIINDVFGYKAFFWIGGAIVIIGLGIRLNSWKARRRDQRELKGLQENYYKEQQNRVERKRNEGKSAMAGHSNSTQKAEQRPDHDHLQIKEPQIHYQVAENRKSLIDMALHSTSFATSGVKDGYKYYALYHYYPKNKYQEVPLSVSAIRSIVYAFKDGETNTSITVATSISDAIKTQGILNNYERGDYVLVIIPASTKEKTAIRYGVFVRAVESALGIKASMKVISVANDHKATKGTVGVDKTKDLSYCYEEIIGKRVLLFDDVKTTGASFVQNANKLKSGGAREVIGIFLAETWDSWKKGHPTWYNIKSPF